MSNEEIYNKLKLKYGEKDLLDFCKKLSVMYQFMWENEQENNRWEPLEFGYDANWWYEKWKHLLCNT